MFVLDFSKLKLVNKQTGKEYYVDRKFYISDIGFDFTEKDNLKIDILTNWGIATAKFQDVSEMNDFLEQFKI